LTKQEELTKPAINYYAACFALAIDYKIIKKYIYKNDKWYFFGKSEEELIGKIKLAFNIENNINFDFKIKILDSFCYFLIINYDDDDLVNLVNLNYLDNYYIESILKIVDMNIDNLFENKLSKKNINLPSDKKNYEVISIK
jgi:hypothetical protein